MRKIDRHLRNIELYGDSHCPRQVEVLDYWYYIKAVSGELQMTGSVGVRTDHTDDPGPGNWHLPFLHHVNSIEDAKRFWYKIQFSRLTVIVCESILPEMEDFSATGYRIRDADYKLTDTVLIEWARCESHRNLCNAPNKRQLCVGPASYAIPWIGAQPIRCVGRTDGHSLHLDEIYDMAMISPDGIVEVTVTRNGRVLVW